MTKQEISELNEVWGKAKTNCQKLGKESTNNYLYAKIKITATAKKIHEELQEAQKLIASELGFKEDESIPQDKVQSIRVRLEGAIKPILDEEVDIETKVLTADELFDCILSIDENKDINTDGKALLMNYLVK